MTMVNLLFNQDRVLIYVQTTTMLNTFIVMLFKLKKINIQMIMFLINQEILNSTQLNLQQSMKDIQYVKKAMPCSAM